MHAYTYKLGSRLDDQKDYGKDIALKFDAGTVNSEKYGEAKVKGHFLLLNPYGKFPQVNVNQVKEKANGWMSEIVNNWRGEIELEECHVISGKNTIPALIAYTAPNIYPKDLKLYFYTCLSLFALDDLGCKFVLLNKDNPNICLKTIQLLAEAMVLIIRGRGDRDITIDQISKLDPIFKTSCMLLSELCKEALSRENTYYFIREYVNGIRAAKWEQEYNNIFSNEDDLLFIRTFSIGLYPPLEAVNLIRGITLSTEVREHPLLQRYLNMAAILIMLPNDIFSLKKEMMTGDDNMNLILLKCSKHSLQRWIEKVVKKTNNFIISIKKVGLKLKLYFPDDANLENFIRSTEYFIDGFLYWQASAPRYGGSE